MDNKKVIRILEAMATDPVASYALMKLNKTSQVYNRLREAGEQDLDISRRVSVGLLAKYPEKICEYIETTFSEVVTPEILVGRACRNWYRRALIAVSAQMGLDA